MFSGLKYWADFIDPLTGKPVNLFLQIQQNTLTNSSLIETDESYRHFGIEINDLGCCKVISHKIWGTYCIISSVFTNAPIEIIEKVVQSYFKK